MTKFLIMTIGLPRSGKSTWVKENHGNHPIVSPDAIRLAMTGDRFIPSIEDYVWAVAKTMVNALFNTGHHIVFLDATNITEERRSRFSGSWVRIFKEFDTSADVCIERAIETNQQDLIEVIKRMNNQRQPVSMLELSAQDMIYCNVPIEDIINHKKLGMVSTTSFKNIWFGMQLPLDHHDFLVRIALYKAMEQESLERSIIENFELVRAHGFEGGVGDYVAYLTQYTIEDVSNKL